MKSNLLIGICFLLLAKSSLSQCPEKGLQINSDACEAATDLRAQLINRSLIQLTWKGSRNQIFVAKVTETNSQTGEFQSEVINSTCNNIGECTAIIFIKPNVEFQWAVQATCATLGAVVQSQSINGNHIDVSSMNAAMLVRANQVKVFPNPARNTLTIDYNEPVTNATKFSVLDATGKQIFSISGNSVKRSNGQYIIDLPGVSNGTHILTIRNEKDIKVAKFVVMLGL